jgi:hypothetical protein
MLKILSAVYARKPDLVIGGDANPYLRRWYVIPRNPVFNIYLHEIVRSDEDRALHCHPWINLSILLEGSYVEHTIRAGGIHRPRRRARPVTGNSGPGTRIGWRSCRAKSAGRFSSPDPRCNVSGAFTARQAGGIGASSPAARAARLLAGGASDPPRRVLPPPCRHRREPAG